jgi:hypothetical protein
LDGFQQSLWRLLQLPSSPFDQQSARCNRLTLRQRNRRVPGGQPERPTSWTEDKSCSRLSRLAVRSRAPKPDINRAEAEAAQSIIHRHSSGKRHWHADFRLLGALEISKDQGAAYTGRDRSDGLQWRGRAAGLSSERANRAQSRRGPRFPG